MTVANYRSELLARETLEAIGLSVESIPRTDNRTADFWVRDLLRSYLVEVTEKMPAEDYRDFLERATNIGGATLTRSVQRENRIDAIINNKADQLQKTQTASDFQLILVTALHDDARHVFDMLYSTVYGVASLVAVDPETYQPSFRDCLFYDHFSFYRQRDLCGVIFLSEEAICLLLNPLCQRADDFRESTMHRGFFERNALIDPDANHDLLKLDFDVDRKDSKAKWRALKAKYGLLTSRALDSKFEGRLTIPKQALAGN